MVKAVWLEKNDLTDAHFIRRKVFVEEQGISEQEEMFYDGVDRAADTFHLVIYDNGLPAATGRIVKTDGKTYIGRVAVLKDKRGQGLGDFCVRLLIRKACENGDNEQFIHAQTSVRAFYEKLGFKAFGEQFIEADIPHISMLHIGDVQSCKGDV